MAIAYLKQSTASTLLIGPIVDSVAATAETGETIAQANVLLWKEGGTTLGAKNEATSCTHRSNGLYTCPVDATDTNTLGVLTVNVAMAGTMVWRGDYCVVPANVYNSIVAGSDYLQSDAYQIAGSTAAATQQAAVANLTVTGAVYATTGGSYDSTNSGALIFYSTTPNDATADTFNGRVVYFKTGNLAKQALAITDYEKVATYGKFTCSVATGIAADGDTFEVL